MTDWNYEIPGKTLLDVVKICGAVVDEVVLQVQKNGILLTAVDASHVAMFAITIGEFDNKKKKLEFGIDLQKLEDIISGHTKATKSHTDYVALNFDNENKKLSVSAGNTSMWTKTIDTNTVPSPSLPHLDPKQLRLVRAEEICPDKFAAALKKQARFGDLAKFILTDEQRISMVTETGGGSLIESILESKNKNLNSQLKKVNAQSHFSLTYLRPFADRVKKAANMTLEVGENSPLIAKWQHEGIDGATGYEVNYFLAPRIESDY